MEYDILEKRSVVLLLCQAQAASLDSETVRTKDFWLKTVLFLIWFAFVINIGHQEVPKPEMAFHCHAFSGSGT